jgi:hypothetical protein
MSYLNGRDDGTIILNGLFTEDTAPTHTALKSLAGGDTALLVSFAMGTNAAPVIGDISCHLRSQQNTYVASPELNGVVGISANFKAKGVPVEYGTLLIDSSISDDNNTASIDNDGSSANGGVGYVHLTGLSAGDSIDTLKITHSDDDAIFEDLITFTLDGSAVGAERIAVTGTVEQYVRAEWTVTGTGVSFPVMISFIRK